MAAIYSHLPTDPDHHHHHDPNTHYVVVLPRYRHPYAAHVSLRRCLISALAALLLCAALFILYPSDPQLQLASVKLNRVRVNSAYPPSLDLSFSLTVRVRNRDVFSLDYRSLDVSVGYRGRDLGVVKSDGGLVRARASSYVDATVDLDGLEIVHDVFFLLEDLARGFIPFDTVSRVEGKLGLFFFNLPIKAKVSCEVLVSTKNQTVVHQDCYPE
uniref:Late embryogenesis abundant protein LEA-2 subgroup domain-containing protein n=1 Tax=Kalanchoe fedtschenkoi TaxID=63787 RepID=A0A7N0TAX4_KALFE